MQRETKRAQLEFKVDSLDEQGVFAGRGNVLEIVDRGDDVIHAGAFKKTINDHGGRFQFNVDHESGIRSLVGIVELEESDNELRVKRGELNLNTDLGRETYERMKFFQERGMPLGLSIEFCIPKGKSHYKDGIRHITEVVLWKLSVVDVPMNQESFITSVKSDTAAKPDVAALFRKGLYGDEVGIDDGVIPDMPTMLQQMEDDAFRARRYQINEALCYVMDEILSADALDENAKMELVDDACSEHRKVMLAWFAEALNRVQSMQEADAKSADTTALDGEPASEPQEDEALRVLFTQYIGRMKAALK